MSRKIAFTGILTGLAVIILYLSAVMPTGKLTMYFLASLPVSVAIVEFGARAGLSVYFAACILHYLVVGNIFAIVPFAFFFGHYPIFKYLIEKKRKAAVEIILKLAFFNLSGLLLYFLFSSLFVNMIPVQFNSSGGLMAVFIAVGQVMFFIYDYVYSRLIFYYESKLSIIRRIK